VRGSALRLVGSVSGTGISADAVTIGGLGEVSVPLWRGAVIVGVVGGVGVAWDRVAAVPTFPGGTGPEDVTTATGVAARAAGWMRASLGPVDIGVAAGVWVQGSSLVVRLPGPFAADADELSRGVITPHLAVSIGADVF
jgi:hypothetical protein